MFLHSADKLAKMRTKFHVIQAKLIMSVWCFTVQCYLAAVMLELFTVWLSSNFPSQQFEAITEHLAPSFKQKSTFSTQLKQFAQLHYLCVQQIFRIVKIFLPSFAQNFNFNLFEDLNTCTYTPVSAEQRWWQVISSSSYLLTSKNIFLSQKYFDDQVQLARTEIVSVAVSITPSSHQQFTIFVIELVEGSKALYKPCATFNVNK